MANNIEWFRQNFENIRVNVDCVKYLEELKIATSTLNPSDLTKIVPELKLDIIFDCLNTSDETQLELAIAIIKKLLSVLNSCDVIKLYGVALGRALEHPNIGAKKLVLNELIRTANNIDLLTVICKEIPLLLSVVECIKSDDLSLASTASQFLNEIGKIQPGIEVLFSSPLLEHIKSISTENDIVRFRVYELIVNISIQSMAGLMASVGSGLLINLLNELQGNDILVQLTSLETVTKLALTDHGMHFLKEKGLFKYLEQQLSDRSNLNSLLLPGFIKFFGNVAQVRPQEIFIEHPSVINLIFELYDSEDPIMSNICLETIGYIASNPKGKQALKEYDLRMQNVMQVIGKLIALQLTERKVIALNVLANILHLDTVDQTPDILNVTKKWFSQLSDNPMKTIMNVCERPFLELKLAGLVTLNAIAEQNWGQEEINKCSGLVEYLLDRNEEGDMNCKAAKYKIVKTIFESPYSRKVFSRDIISRFQVHVKQGVIYVQSKTEVAFEGAT